MRATGWWCAGALKPARRGDDHGLVTVRLPLRPRPAAVRAGAVAAAPYERDAVSDRERALVTLAISVTAVLSHAVEIAVLRAAGAPGDQLVLALTAVPWVLAALGTGAALVRRGGVGPVTTTGLLAAGAIPVAVDGALTGALGQALFCGIGLAGIALGVGAFGSPRSVLAAAPVVLGSQTAMVLAALGTSALGWFMAAATTGVSAAVLGVAVWMHGQSRSALTVLAASAVTDPLTGLLNRRGMGEGFSRVRGAAGDGQRACAIVVDLDHFKAVNDTLGHSAGDQALVAVATVLRAQARSGDLVVRLGGEEMAWIGCWDDEGAAAAAAERLRRAVDEAAMPFGLHLTLSGGVAFSTDVTQGLPDAEALSRLLVRADEALYRAKGEGRDRIAVAVPLSPASADPGRGGAPAPQVRGAGSSSGTVGAGGTQRA